VAKAVKRKFAIGMEDCEVLTSVSATFVTFFFVALAPRFRPEKIQGLLEEPETSRHWRRARLRTALETYGKQWTRYWICY